MSADICYMYCYNFLYIFPLTDDIPRLSLYAVHTSIRHWCTCSLYNDNASSVLSIVDIFHGSGIVGIHTGLYALPLVNNRSFCMYLHHTQTKYAVTLRFLSSIQVFDFAISFCTYLGRTVRDVKSYMSHHTWATHSVSPLSFLKYHFESDLISSTLSL